MLPHNLGTDKCNKNVNNVIYWTIKIIIINTSAEAPCTSKKFYLTLKELDLTFVQFENLWI